MTDLQLLIAVTVPSAVILFCSGKTNARLTQMELKLRLWEVRLDKHERSSEDGPSGDVRAALAAMRSEFHRDIAQLKDQFHKDLATLNIRKESQRSAFPVKPDRPEGYQSPAIY